jgi:hypothetical protein
VFVSTLCDLIKNYKYCKSDADQVPNDADIIKPDQPIIGPIKEALRTTLTSIASKLLCSEHSKHEDLSSEEQNLWKSFDNSDIYEFITGEPDCLPEFQFHWIIIKRVSWFKSSLLLRIQSDSFTNINS